MRIAKKLQTAVENPHTFLIYFQQMSNGQTALSFQGDSYDHIKNTA